MGAQGSRSSAEKAADELGPTTSEARLRTAEPKGLLARTPPEERTERIRFAICEPLVDLGGVVFAGDDYAVRRREKSGDWLLVSATESDPCGIVADAGKVYWTESGTPENHFEDGRVVMASFDGAEVIVLADNQGSPAAMAKGEKGIYWLESATGGLWRYSASEGTEKIAEFPPDLRSWAHGHPALGMDAANGYVAWANYGGKSNALRVVYASEDGRERGVLAEFDRCEMLPRDLLIHDRVVYFYTFCEEVDGLGRIEKLDVPSGEGQTVWEGSAFFLTVVSGRVVWGDEHGSVFSLSAKGRLIKHRQKLSLVEGATYVPSGDHVSWATPKEFGTLTLQ